MAHTLGGLELLISLHVHLLVLRQAPSGLELNDFFRPSELVIFIHLNLLVLQSEPEEMPPEAKMRMKNIGR